VIRAARVGKADREDGNVKRGAKSAADRDTRFIELLFKTLLDGRYGENLTKELFFLWVHRVRRFEGDQNEVAEELVAGQPVAK
jgi:hypothetical protein